MRAKLVSVFAGMAGIIFLVCALMYGGTNRTMKRIDQIYSTNVSLNELKEGLESVQNDMYEYLKTRSSDTLELYYQDVQDYTRQIEELNDKNTDSEQRMLEKNIRHMSESYLSVVEDTIQAKRGRNVQGYKDSYEEATQLYGYVQHYMDKLNNLRFQNNSHNYEVMYKAVGYLEWMTLILFLAITLICLLLLMVNISHMTEPLKKLSLAANEVSKGNFDVEFPENHGKDEIGVVTSACNKMMESIRIYIAQIRDNMTKEQEMKERELLMETHLKDAQLKYLQAQINPHFLFNSLNAGAQLAMLENAERTGTFVERMADFFRYNVKKMEEDATLKEELEAVDNYVYIMNVRFSGDIHFYQEVPENLDLCDYRVPSMILQPLVENAMNHGIRNVDWETYVRLSVTKGAEHLYICVEDNGKGMSPEQISQILHGQVKGGPVDGYSTGIAIDNVMNRLALYYGEEELLDIRSEGIGKGSQFIIRIPLTGGKKNVSDLIS